jgi:hypothetical protein
MLCAVPHKYIESRHKRETIRFFIFYFFRETTLQSEIHLIIGVFSILSYLTPSHINN